MGIEKADAFTGSLATSSHSWAATDGGHESAHTTFVTSLHRPLFIRPVGRPKPFNGAR